MGNAAQTAQHYQAIYGMELVAYAGPETGLRDHHSYVLESGAARFVINGAVEPDSPLVAIHGRHGDGIVDIALQVPDVDKCIEHARQSGPGCSRSRTISPTNSAPCEWAPSPRTATPGTPWCSARTTTARTCPATSPAAPADDRPDDATPAGCSRPWTTSWAMSSSAAWTSGCDFYNQVMGFTNMAEFVGDDIATEYSALMSKVVASGNHRVKFPLNEPAPGKKRSQIDEYLEYYNGPGPQHVALATDDILATVDQLRARGVEFLATPAAYYEDPELRARIGSVRVPVEELQQRGILVDRDEDGYLLQIFTKPIGDRPTVFFELIERHGSLGFGKGNFQALFEAIEREQELRGNF